MNEHLGGAIYPLLCMSHLDHESHIWLDGDGKTQWKCNGWPIPSASTSEDEMKEPYDQTIRPLLCGKNKGIHEPHNWEAPPNRTWACPGRTVPCICEPSSKLGLDNPGLHTLDCPSYRGPERKHCDTPVKHEPHAWRWDGKVWGCPGTVRPKSTEVAKWADKAMFSAEPIDAQEGPRVYLLWMTPDPLGAIAAACKMYKGEVVRDLATVTDAERLEYLEQIQKTKLKAPFEFVKFHFMIEGVTRAFTHQMVRQRTAVYAQESLRFAVKEDMPMAIPPSIAANPEALRLWEEDNQRVGDTYHKLIDMGIPAEDARGRLPHDILTRLHYSTDLRALLDHAGNRLCTQAQFEWRLVFAQIVNAIRNTNIKRVNPEFDKASRAHTANGTSHIWMADMLTDLFKPVCYQTGRCEFKANFDRACSIRDRVDANERAGRPSSEWDEQKEQWDPDGSFNPISPIKPGEWLLDPGAARKKG